jgi:hypothetical protein
VHGCNITGNGNGAIYSRTTFIADEDTIWADNNWWGTTDPDSIEDLIIHQTDNSFYPLVEYLPCAPDSFDFSSLTVVDENEGPGVLPQSFRLAQNYPNPFNNSTIIEFTLKRPGSIELALFDILGRRVRELTAGVYPAGEFALEFTGQDDAGRNLPSGVYFYRLKVDQQVQTRKLLLLK